MKKLFGLLVGFGLLGCQSTYTSIQPAGDKAFMITKTSGGFFKVSGSLYSCTAEGKKMTCTEIDSR